MWSPGPGGHRDAAQVRARPGRDHPQEAWSARCAEPPPPAESAVDVSGSRAVWLTRRSTSRCLLGRIAPCCRPATTANRSIDMPAQRRVTRIRRGGRRARTHGARVSYLGLVDAQRESASPATGPDALLPAARRHPQPRVRDRARRRTPRGPEMRVTWAPVAHSRYALHTARHAKRHSTYASARSSFPAPPDRTVPWRSSSS